MINGQPKWMKVKKETKLIQSGSQKCFLTVAKVGKKLSLYAGDDEAKPVQANCWMIECFYRTPLTPHQSEKGVKTEQNITNKKRRKFQTDYAQLQKAI